MTIYGIGIDSGHLDKPHEEYTVHQLFGSENMYILQNLKDLHVSTETSLKSM